MRLTIISNYNHGTTIGAQRVTRTTECLKQFLEKQEAEYFEAVSQEVSLDRDCELDSESAGLSMDDILSAPSVCKRHAFAPLNQRSK